MKKIVILMILIAMPLVLALNKPASDNLYAISQPDALSTGLQGQTCYETYSTTGSYCSVNIREYYQCVPSMSGNVWEFRSENCGSYTGMTCKMQDGKAECVSGSSTNINWKTWAIIGGVILVVYFIFRKK